jgi:thiosulfate/3-mercaptopyruvate sulfurtransferase
VSTEEVIGRLGKPDVQLLDVRTLKEFKGQDIRAIRGGHIPGATHIPFEQNWVDPETPKKLAERKVQTREGMGLKPLDQLKALYAQLDPNKETVVYCQSGVRSAQTATVLRELGFKDVKVYESSWLGYASRLDAPAEDVTFVNVGLLNSRIAGLQARVEMLERELAARTAAPGVR